MKIGIITQPLYTNFGGLLQAYALQLVLKRMGHSVLTVDVPMGIIPLKRKMFSLIKHFILRYVFHKHTAVRIWPTPEEVKMMSRYTDAFVKENISTTEKVISKNDFKFLKRYSFRAYVVGSDQVWRPRYNPFLESSFLEFIEKDAQMKRVAYAASFGVDDWEFSTEQTNKFAELAGRFDKISVREESGVKLCKKYFNVDADHIIDPTLLLSQDDYKKLAKYTKPELSKNKLTIYILDNSLEKKLVIEKVSKAQGLMPYSVLPRKKFTEPGKRNIEDCIFPPVSEWIRSFIDARFIVTDSFHGTIFSIIFNKPFFVVGNSNRGMARFSSLLKMFNLQDRLIHSADELTVKKINTVIDYDSVNRILYREKNKAKKFLEDALGIVHPENENEIEPTEILENILNI